MPAIYNYNYNYAYTYYPNYYQNYQYQQYLPPPPPINGSYFFEANAYKAESLAASTTRRFLGIRLECAQCHNHPFARWTRQQFWEFAAFFAAVQVPNGLPYYSVTTTSQPTGQIPNPAGGRELKIPGTNKVVKARFLDGKTPDWKNNAESRHALAEWITAPTNPYFARTGANRLWAHFFGVGIIDPVDDEPTDENPASHPELLDELTAQFVAHKYDVKFLIRAIIASKAYQRQSAATDPRQNDPRLFARMAVKGLSAEQLFDNLALATGRLQPAEPQPAYPQLGAQFTAAAGKSPRSEFVQMFANQDKKTETQTSILQALTMMNGKLVTDATSITGNSKLAALVNNASLSNAQKIESLYLSTLSRFPRPEEAERMSGYVNARPDPRAAFADIFWALLNSSEFRFNH